MENVENDSQIFYIFKKLAAEKNVGRLDDDFLRRFLVGHYYNVNKALRAICSFQNFIDRRKDTWLNLERKLVENIFESQIIDVLDGTGLQGQTIVWIRLDKWDPEIFTPDEILKVSGLLCELVYVKMKQIKCIDVIMDMHDFSLKHLCSLSKKFAKRMIFFMSECLPMELLHIYVVRQPKMFHFGYALYKPFIEERMKKIIHICGNSYECLIENIGKDCLPTDFNGTYENLKSSRWINIMYQRKTRKGGRQAHLILLLYYVWSRIKSTVFATTPTTKDNMKERVRRSVTEELLRRINKFLVAKGQQFEHLGL